MTPKRSMTRQSTMSPWVAVLALSIATSVSCVNDRITSSRSSSLLIVERIGAAPGGTNEDPINTFLQSDVETGGGVFEDIGRVTVRIALKDPGSAKNPRHRPAPITSPSTDTGWNTGGPMDGTIPGSTYRFPSMAG